MTMTMTPDKARGILAALPAIEANQAAARRLVAELRYQAELALAVGVPLDQVVGVSADARDKVTRYFKRTGPRKVMVDSALYITRAKLADGTVVIFDQPIRRVESVSL